MLFRLQLRSFFPFLLAFLLFIGIIPQPVHAAGVVGNGTPGSCTRNAIAARLANGGTVRFNCGPNKVTIPITETLNFQQWNTVLDGGNKVILEGVPGVQMIFFNTWGFNASRTITIKNLTIKGASISGAGEDANGAAIRVENQSAMFNDDLPILIVNNVQFKNNVSTLTGIPQDLYGYDFGGGAIYIIGGKLTVKNSTFTGNEARGGAGGAIHGLGSNITITNSKFTNNSTSGNPGAGIDPTTDSNIGHGGAIYIDGALFRGNGKINIQKTTFNKNNSVNTGGAIHVNMYNSRNPLMTINNSRFIDNTVDNGQAGWGGAISGGGTGGPVRIKITNSLFDGNTAAGALNGGDGGALGFAQPTTLTIANSTFTDNTAEVNCGDTCFRGRGGAMYISNAGDPFKIYNSTIAHNEAGWFAGGILGDNGELYNTIVAHNTALNRGNGGTVAGVQCGDTLSGTHNLMFPDATIDCSPNITVKNPRLNALTGNVLPLKSNSPAINKGSNAICNVAPVNKRDQRGTKRPQGARCDIGAYEFIP